MSYVLMNGSVRTVATRGVTTAAFNHAGDDVTPDWLDNNGQILGHGIVPRTTFERSLGQRLFLQKLQRVKCSSPIQRRLMHCGAHGKRDATVKGKVLKNEVFGNEKAVPIAIVVSLVVCGGAAAVLLTHDT